jgi:ankyrin repeat protein
VLAQIIKRGVDATDDAYLMETIKKGFLASATVLVKNGADANYIDPSNNNYLHIIAGTEHRQLVPLFTANGADINTINAAGNTPLQIAIRKGRRADDLVGDLINAGADVNIRDGSGEYHLDMAKSTKVKRALKKAGAKSN